MCPAFCLQFALCYVVMTGMRAKRYTVSDGRIVLYLRDAEEGGYLVTSPLDPELITEAETIEEAFLNACDAAKSLKQSRRKLMRKLQSAGAA